VEAAVAEANDPTLPRDGVLIPRPNPGRTRSQIPLEVRR
jgi:pyrroloquinoline quinone biosynthesis protein E